jgi:hypothetical protein
MASGKEYPLEETHPEREEVYSPIAAGLESVLMAAMAVNAVLF